MGYRSINKPPGVGSRAGRLTGRARAVGGRPLQPDSRLLVRWMPSATRSRSRPREQCRRRNRPHGQDLKFRRGGSARVSA